MSHRTRRTPLLESRIDGQVGEARERGLFDGLEGSGALLRDQAEAMSCAWSGQELREARVASPASGAMKGPTHV